MIALIVALAGAQVSSVAVQDFTIEDCTARPIVGTVPYNIARQAVDTNAQVYGAVAFAEEVLLEDEGSFWGVRMHNVYNATRLPTAAACPTELQWGTAGLDLYASSSGLMVPLFLERDDLDVRLFYAGSVTGSVVQFPSNKWAHNRVFTAYGFTGAAFAATYAAPAAVLLTKDSGAQQMVGDFVAGVEASLPNHPEIASFRAGYVYSQGLYSGVSSRKLHLFASSLLTGNFDVLSLAKAGIQRLPIAERIGRISLYGKKQLLHGPSPITPQTTGPGASRPGAIDLMTLHFEQEDIGGYVDIRAAYALRPTPFLHEGAITVKVPGEVIEMEDLTVLAATLGVSELPAMPWYAVQGGRQLYFDISAFDVIHIRRNAPSTLVVFPYAQNATEFSLEFEVSTDLAKP